MPPLSRRTCLSLTLASIVSTSARAQVPAISTEQFNAWIRLRGGEHTPAYWYSAGLIRPIEDEGAVASRMVGLETWITPPDLRTETSAV